MQISLSEYDKERERLHQEFLKNRESRKSDDWTPRIRAITETDQWDRWRFEQC